jgi:integrase
MRKVYTHLHEEWRNSNPTVATWYQRLARRAKNTGDVFSSMLWKYWKESLSKRYASVEAWRNEVKSQVRNEDVQVSRKWVRDLEDYATATTLRQGSRNVLAQAVKSYLCEAMDLPKLRVNLESENMPEEHHYPVLTADEIKLLVDRASTRDKAIILTMVSGALGEGEFLRFAKEWNKYRHEISEKRVPLRIEMKRPKTNVRYWTLLFSDAVNALNSLLRERGREERVVIDLFVNQHGKPIDDSDIQESIRRIADATGVDPSKPGTRIYRVRPHAFRHYFKTTCTNAGVSDIVSKFLSGRGGKDIERVYDQFMETEKGQQRIIKEMEQAVPELNVVTRTGQPLLKDHLEEIRVKAMRETYKALLETGVLKPETLTEPVLQIVADKIGVKYEKLLFLADEDALVLPEETRTRLGLFDVIAGALDLSRETWRKYMHALKVVKPARSATSWENHEWYWLRAQIGSDEYMQALADGYEIVDKEDGGMRILRKPKLKIPSEAHEQWHLSGRQAKPAKA